MIEYLYIFIAGILVGCVDFLIKGTTDNWNTLKDWFKGWTWHLTIASFYILLLLGISQAHNADFYYWAILGIINEDMVYYMLKSGWFGKLCYNSWFHIGSWYVWKSALSYYLTVGVINIILLGIYICRSYI